MALTPDEEKVVRGMIDREIALPRLIQAREDAEAALAAAQAAAQNERIQVEVSAQALISEVWQRHTPAITAARAALETAKAAEDAAKLGAAEVKP